jgi:RNA polymerase sigma-54 factor
MSITQKLQTRLSQKLILTPLLQQAIKLLPIKTLELMDMLNQEVIDNPLLEKVTTEELKQTDAEAQVEKPEPEPPSERQDTWDDADYDYFFGDYLDEGYRPRIPREVKDLQPIENTLSTVGSLSEHLMWQLSALSDDDLTRKIGTAIIGNVDEDGYLVVSTGELVAMRAAQRHHLTVGHDA